MASSNIKLFDENKGNMLSDSEFSISNQRMNGLQTGVASSQLQNKAMYQASLVAYAIAQIMMQNGKNANDTDAVSAFVANLSGAMLQKVYDLATTEEAKAGVATGKWMSPALVKAAIDTLAAPAGYGLGGFASEVVKNDYNNYVNNGWYALDNTGTALHAPYQGAGYGVLVVSSGGSIVIQDIYGPNWGVSGKIMWNHLRRVNTLAGDANNWSEWEWAEPPMFLGVEYRTTERHCGKPVYKQVFACGKLSGAAGTTEYYPFGANETAGAHNVFSADFYTTTGNQGYEGWMITLPVYNQNGSLNTAASVDGTKIKWYTSGDWSAYYGYAILKYTKPQLD